MQSSHPQARPRPANPVKVFQRGDLALLLVPATGAWTVTTDTGRQIALLCDGERSVADIAAALSARYGITPSRALADTEAYLSQLAEAAVLADTPPDPPSQPAYYRGEVAFNITARCNLQCRHCYARSGPDRSETLPLQLVVQTMQALEHRAGYFVFSGGEPLLYPHWRELLTSARRLATTKIVTNATLLTQDDAAWLAEHDISVQISLDGATPDTHDWLRAPGSFAQVKEAVGMLGDAGHLENVLLGYTLTKRNLEETLSFLDLAIEWGVRSVYFMPVNRHGRAADNWEELGLTMEQYEDIYRQLSARRRELRGTLNIAGCVGDYVERSLTTGGPPRCPVGDNLLVEFDGDMYPCILLTGSDYYLGRLGEVDSTATFSSETRRHAVELCRRRLETVPECAECDWRALCQGACPGTVLWRTGTLQAIDGLCELRRELYLNTIFDLAATGGELPPADPGHSLTEPCV
jgi:Fe-coproporphyrin III synthase